MDIFNLTKPFPSEERYSLTGQIRRSSRSIPENIAEGYGRRQYPKAFVNKTSDTEGECTGTRVGLDFSKNCGFPSAENQRTIISDCDEIGKMLGAIVHHRERFTLDNNSLTSEDNNYAASCRLLLLAAPPSCQLQNLAS
jgi:four helix bundle protein